MGWVRGSYVMDEIIQGLKDDNFEEAQRKRVYMVIIPAMQSCDWDTEHECVGQDPAYDDAMRELCLLDEDYD